MKRRRRQNALLIWVAGWASVLDGLSLILTGGFWPFSGLTLRWWFWALTMQAKYPWFPQASPGPLGDQPDDHERAR